MQHLIVKRENEEFIELLNASGWSQAEAGRRLHRDRASISRYVSGEIPVERSILELFKFVLSDERPDLLRAAAPGERLPPSDDVEAKLRELKERDPEAYDLVKGQVHVLHERISRTPDEVAVEAARRGAAEVQKPPVVYGRRKSRESKSRIDQATSEAARRAVDNARKGRS